MSSFGPPSMVIEADENGRAEFECMAAGPPTPNFVVKKTQEAPGKLLNQRIDVLKH